MLVAIGHTAVTVGHIRWWMLVAVVRTAAQGVGVLVGVDHIGRWGSRGQGVVAVGSTCTGQWVVTHWVVLSAYR